MRTVEVTPGLSPGWRTGRGPLALLPVLLFRDRQPLLTIAVAWALALGGSVALGLVIARLVPGGAGPDLGHGSALMKLVLIDLFSPVVETLIMAGLLTLLLRMLRPWQAVVASALLWGGAHSAMAPLWGAVIWWPFLIFSIVFVTWRPRGAWRACAIAASVHILQNLLPAIAIAAH